MRLRPSSRCDAVILHLTPDERDYLVRMLGGPSEQGTRTLGVGLTGQGVLAFRQKVFEAAEISAADVGNRVFDRDEMERMK